ncbi:hypothetical protein PROFUN_01628 [Planoprotostelium fungivorum]|uniref:Uncharacterized protein n=1 Tax=Planoprotostelium fungivorum TaxID=1890364 RepID=A0A2P6NTU9_9EUKA|nr:hypothetical protein PROFUN_01628 [Planoprotostelium fungivorum]
MFVWNKLGRRWLQIPPPWSIIIEDSSFLARKGIVIIEKNIDQLVEAIDQIECRRCASATTRSYGDRIVAGCQESISCYQYKNLIQNQSHLPSAHLLFSCSRCEISDDCPYFPKPRTDLDSSSELASTARRH